MSIVLNKIREVNDYIKKYYLRLSIILFAIYILTSVISYFVVAALPDESMKEIIEKLREIYITDELMDKEGLSLSWSIFVHNLRASGVNIVSAIIPILFFPLWSIISNGIAMGAVFGIGNYGGAANMFLSFLKYVLPHGIFEIPIFILSCAIGLRLCVLIIKKIFRKAKDESFKYHYEKLSEILIIYIIPFLLIAAFLEGFLEPLIFGM